MDPIRRRTFLKSSAAVAAAGAVGVLPGCKALMGGSSPGERSSLKQVAAGWCFTGNASPAPWTPEQFVANCAELGLPGVELMRPEQWHLLREYDLVCAATPSHPFVRGMNHLGHHEACFEALNRAITASAEAGFPNVMTFTGLADTSNHPNGGVVTADQGMANCIAGYRHIAPIAADQGVTLVLEPLNSRATEHMRGHPGYQGDHVDYCARIVREVDSPGLRLLFDVYHVQIMDGDLVRRIHENADIIGHVQIAGNPGRGPITSDQEINYRAVMQAFVDIGYEGYIGHEWIPTGDPLLQLRQSVEACIV